MNKRGVTQHIEMIIATVLFIFFFIFILLFVKPYETNVLSESLIDGIKYEINRNCSIEVVQLFVNVDPPVDSAFCFNIPSYLNLEDAKCVAFDLNKNSFSCFLDSRDICVEGNNPGGYNILFSSDLTESNYVTGSEGSSVSLGGSTKREMLSYNSLIKLNESYYSDYNEVKKELGLPFSYDFSISSSIVNLTKQIPKDIEVLGREFVEAVIYENGTIINERFLIKVW